MADVEPPVVEYQNLTYDRPPLESSRQVIPADFTARHKLSLVENEAFWEDRYHATAVDSDDHLRRCLV